MIQLILVFGIIHTVASSVTGPSLSSSWSSSSSLPVFAIRPSKGTLDFRNNNDIFHHSRHGELIGCKRNSGLLLLSLRGGSTSDEEADESDDDDDEEDDDALFEGMEVSEVPDEDFDEDNFIDRMIARFREAPPLTRTYLGVSFCAAIIGAVLNKGEFPPFLSFDVRMILTRLQFWRVVSPFLNLGRLNLFWLLTAQFTFDYMSGLEKLLHRTPYDFWIMVAFGMLSMVIGYPALKLSPTFLGHNLATYLVYIWSRYHEGNPVRVLGLVDTKAELLPWFMIGQTYLLEGEIPKLDLLGIVFGFIYYYLNSVGVLKAPKWLFKWYKDSTGAEGIRAEYEKISTDFGGV